MLQKQCKETKYISSLNTGGGESLCFDSEVNDFIFLDPKTLSQIIMTF